MMAFTAASLRTFGRGACDNTDENVDFRLTGMAVFLKIDEEKIESARNSGELRALVENHEGSSKLVDGKQRETNNVPQKWRPKKHGSDTDLVKRCAFAWHGEKWFNSIPRKPKRTSSEAVAAGSARNRCSGHSQRRISSCKSHPRPHTRPRSGTGWRHTPPRPCRTQQRSAAEVQSEAPCCRCCTAAGSSPC